MFDSARMNNLKLLLIAGYFSWCCELAQLCMYATLQPSAPMPAPTFKKYRLEYYTLLIMGMLMVIVSGVLSVRSSHFHYEATLVSPSRSFFCFFFACFCFCSIEIIL
jgi:hypothetical protein